MRVEAPVLDGDEGLGQIGRQIAEAHGRPAGVAAIGEQAAVIGENGDIGRALRHGEEVDRRQFGRVESDDERARDARPDHRRQEPGGRRDETRVAPAPAASCAAALFALWRSIHLKILPRAAAQPRRMISALPQP